MNNIFKSSIINSLIDEIKQVDISRIRNYHTEERNLQSICSIKCVENMAKTTKELELKKAYCQLSIRGDGNCFYRTIILLYILQLASEEDHNYLKNFIVTIHGMNNVKIDYSSANINTKDLKNIFLIFLMKVYAWKQQQQKVNISMILNEYNSLPEVDLAANSICRYLIYQTFVKFSSHPVFNSFIDEEMKKRIPKILLKQKEYAEDIIIPLVAQTFQCELIVQNLFQEKSKSNQINIKNQLYKPLISSQENQNIQLKQIHVLFTNNHYDALIHKQKKTYLVDFYSMNSTTFTTIYQNTETHIDFLYLQKFKLSQNINDSKPKQTSQIVFDEDYFNFSTEKSKSNQNRQLSELQFNQNSVNQNQYPQNEFIFQQNNKDSNSDIIRCISCSKKIHSACQSYQVQTMKQPIQKICTNCYNIISNNISKNQQYFNINGLQYEFIAKQEQQDKESKQQQSSILINIHQQICGENVQSKINQIPSQSSYLTNQDTNNQYHLSQITKSNDQNNQSMKLNEESLNNSILPVLKFESDSDNDSVNHENLILLSESDDEDDDEINDKTQQNDQEQLKKQQQNQSQIGRTVCIKCRLPFKSTKYLLKGKQMVLLCSECLEIIINNIDRDQKSITIDNQFYLFSESILNKIKEQKIEENAQSNDFKKMKKSVTFAQPAPNVFQRSLLQRQSEINISSTQSNSYNQTQQTSQMRKQVCNICSQSCSSSQEVILVKEGEQEEKQRICEECVLVFVIYYENPLEIVMIGDKIYKIDKTFAKYLNSLKSNQQQELNKNIKSISSTNSTKSSKEQPCFICKKSCAQALKLENVDNKNAECFVCRNCFYVNVRNVYKSIFVYKNKQYKMQKKCNYQQSCIVDFNNNNNYNFSNHFERLDDDQYKNHQIVYLLKQIYNKTLIFKQLQYYNMTCIQLLFMFLFYCQQFFNKQLNQLIQSINLNLIKLYEYVKLSFIFQYQSTLKLLKELGYYFIFQLCSFSILIEI